MQGTLLMDERPGVAQQSGEGQDSGEARKLRQRAKNRALLAVLLALVALFYAIAIVRLGG